MSSTTTTLYKNWDRSVQCQPRSRAAPSSTAEVRDIVLRARERRERVRAVGSGHSWSDIALTDGCLLDTSRLDAVRHVDRDKHRATVQAGIRLHDLNRALHEQGLGMPIVGAIDQQALAGVTATATHGTGIGFGPISSYVEEVELVTGTGEILRCSRAVRPDLFAAAECHLGCLGVITEMVLRCEPAFRLRRIETKRTLDDVLATLDDDVNRHEHYGVWWVPHTDTCLALSMDRTSDAPRTKRIRRFLTTALVRNLLLDWVSRIAGLHPPWVRATNRAAALLTPPREEVVDDSHRLFSMPFWIKHRECEYAIPRERAREAIEALRQILGAHTMSLFIDLRFVKASQGHLSPSHGRDSCYISMTQHASFEYQALFDAFEELMQGLDGRPHWGKHSRHFDARLRSRYPGWDDFFALQRALDPDGIFVTPFIERLRGAG